MSKNLRRPAAAVHVGKLNFDAFEVGTELRRGDTPVAITPKALAVLRALVERAGQLVTKEALFDLVWPGVIVTDAALTMCIAEIRGVLGDNPRRPRYIATVPKRGYRFICPTSAPTALAAPSPPAEPVAQIVARRTLVGRDDEMRVLHDAMTAASAGHRRLIFAVGEPGIGKTALLHAFKHETDERPGVFVISGQCSEHFGPSEPYLPLLDGIGRACRARGGETLLACLSRHAPLWLAQLPDLLKPGDVEILQQRIARATPARMLRELAEAIEALAARQTVVLCLEDLHWSDHATLDWLGFVARRQTAARLLVIGTLRDAPTLRRDHPLHELLASLRVHPQCRVVQMSPFAVTSIRHYLEQRLDPTAIVPGHARLGELAVVLHARTGGNPLYLTNLVDEAFAPAKSTDRPIDLDIALEQLRRPLLPASLKQSIMLQLDQLSRDESALLEAASVAGENFSTAALATAMELGDDEGERRCEEVARETRLIMPAGLSEWPDGTVASRYTFKHSLYRELLYTRVPDGRAVRMHRLIGQRLERAFGPAAASIAAELAMHYTRGHARPAAARFCLAAGRSALERAAYAEAEAHFRQGLAQLAGATPAQTEDTRATAFALQMALGQTLLAIRGWASPAAEEAFTRAHELRAPDDNTGRFMPLWGVAMGLVVRGDFDRYEALARELAADATTSADPTHLACAHWADGQCRFHRGDFEGAADGLQRAVSGFDRIPLAEQLNTLGTDFRVFSRAYLSHAWWCLGRADRALAASQTAIELAREGDHAFSTALAHAYAAMLHLVMDDLAGAERDATAAVEVSTTQGFQYYLGWGQFVLGWIGGRSGEAQDVDDRMQQGLAAMGATGARLRLAYYLALLAERRAQQGHLSGAREALAAAFEEFGRTGERCWEAELHRIGGIVEELGENRPHLAENCYRRAVAVAREQHALSWELRAALPLARLLAQTGRTVEAERLLIELCAQLREGFASRPFQEAKRLLESLR